MSTSITETEEFKELDACIEEQYSHSSYYIPRLHTKARRIRELWKDLKGKMEQREKTEEKEVFKGYTNCNDYFAINPLRWDSESGKFVPFISSLQK